MHGEDDFLKGAMGAVELAVAAALFASIADGMRKMVLWFGCVAVKGCVRFARLD